MATIKYYRITIRGQKFELQDFCAAYDQAFTCIGVKEFTEDSVTFEAITGDDFPHAYSPTNCDFLPLEHSLSNDERA